MTKTNLTQTIKNLENLIAGTEYAINLLQDNTQEEKRTEATHIIKRIITSEIKNKSNKNKDNNCLLYTSRCV